MPTSPTAQPAVLPLGAHGLVVIAVDLGADGLPAWVREAAVDRLAEAGLARLTDLGQLPSTPVAGWSAEIGGGRLRLTSPAEVVYDGTLAAWPALKAAAAETGAAIALVGHIDLGWGARVLPAAAAAAERGEVAAGVVPARLTG